MYKNKTLKGLAIGAALALGFSGFAAAPASANYGLADKTFVTLEPALGDEFAVLANGTFTVVANKAPVTGELKLLVEDSLIQVTSSPSLSARAANNSFVLDGTHAEAGSTSASTKWSFRPIGPDRSAASASVTVKVTAWVDSNGNGKIDSTEYASPTETISFVDSDTVALSVTLNRPVVGAASISAVVSSTPTLNHDLGADLFSGALASVVFQRAGFPQTASNSAQYWDEDDRLYTVTSPNFKTFGFPSVSEQANASVSSTVLGTVKITGVATGAQVGDGFIISTSATTVFNSAATVSKVISATEFEATTLTTSPNVTFSAVAASISTIVSVLNKVTPATYNATGIWNGVAIPVSQFATGAVVSDKVEINIAGSANVSAVIASTTADAKVRAGTLTVDVMATVLDEDGDAVAAGKSVVISNGSITGTGFRVNGKTGADSVLTDANGQVKATVTTPAGAAGSAITLTFTAEGSVAGTAALTWATTVFALSDLSVANSTLVTDRAVLKGGSFDLDLMVVDQWYAKPAATDTYRVVVTGSGAVNGIVPVSEGRASVTIGDNGLATSYTTHIQLQKLGTSGAYALVSGFVVTTRVVTGAVTLGAAGTTLFGNAVVLSSAVAAKALVEADLRTTVVAIPAYANNAVVNGIVRNATTGVAVGGAYVTISGPTSLLFGETSGNVFKRGSITLVADSDGKFEVNIYSTTAAKDVVVTAASLGNSATTKVTFTGIGVGEGTSLVITAPDTVEPASTLQVKAKLTDAFGNGVTAAAGRMKVTYTGPGITFGTLPTATDATGELMFSVLLGAADKGTITVVVSYDQNGDGDFVDAKDLNTTKTITIGAAAPAAPAADQRITVGSFKGFVAIYTLNYTGQKLSAKVAGKWLVENNLSRFERVVRLTGAAIPIVVDLYIDGTFVRTENIVTK